MPGHELAALWRAAFDANPAMYFIVDEAGDIVCVNDGGARQLGYTADELVGRPVLDVFVDADRAFVQESAAHCLRQPGRTLRWEARKVRKDGTVLWVRETANAVDLPAGRPVLLLACEEVTERKRAEQALRDSEERFRTLVQFSFDVYWETDAQHRFVRQEFGPALSAALPTELGKTRWEVPSLEPDEEAWRRHRETLEAHLPFRDFELARPAPGGGKRYVSVSGLPVFDAGGAFLGYRGVGRNITERKRAEAALRQREKELRDIFETMPAMAFVVDADGRHAVGNRRWLDYSGGRPDGGTPAGVHPLDAARYKEARRHSIQTGEPFEQEVRLRRFDGAYRWFLSRAVPLRDEQGTIVKWYGVHTDIHELKLAEEERAAHVWFLESMDRLNRAMQGTHDLEQTMSAVLDAVLEIFDCDRAWLIYPCDPQASTWRAVMEHTRPQFPGAFALGAEMPVGPDMAGMFSAARAAGGAVLYGPGHDLQVAAGGSERYAVRSRMVTVVRPKVDRPYLFGLHQCSHPRVWSEQEKRLFEEIGRRLDDVLTSLLVFRSLREAEAALERVNRVTTLGVLAASIAHEVNQPLGAITTSAASCARWLAAQPPQMDRARAALRRITEDGRRAAQVVDRIRALVNRQAPRRARFDLNEAIREVVALTRNEMRRHAITLACSLSPDVPPIVGDRVQLQQVVLNLIVNAIEAMSGSEGPRELAIACGRDGADTVTAQVRDSGPGIDPARAERLFEAFYTSKADGIGMGLSISRSIVEAHGGRLWVAPDRPGGATFRFSLPVEPPEP